MIKSITAKLYLLFLLIAITTCYYERDIDEELKVCFVKDLGVWTMNIDGSEQRQIVSGFFNNAPSWSPDGENILFYKFSGPTNIYVINSDGNGLKQLTHTLHTDFSNYPTWSSDGERIIFAGQMNSKYYSFIANKYGIIQDKIEFPNQLTCVAMSPNGNDIYALDNTNKFYVINIKSRLTTFSKSTDYSSFSISPNGITLACVNESTSYIDFWNIITDTSVQLIKGSSSCWTPDGKTIVYIDSSNNICSLNIDSLEYKPLTTGGGYSEPCVKWKPR